MRLIARIHFTNKNTTAKEVVLDCVDKEDGTAIIRKYMLGIHGLTPFEIEWIGELYGNRLFEVEFEARKFGSDESFSYNTVTVYGMCKRDALREAFNAQIDAGFEVRNIEANEQLLQSLTKIN